MYIMLPKWLFRIVTTSSVTAAIVCFGLSAGFAEPPAAKQPAPPRSDRQNVEASNKPGVIWGGPQLRRIESEWSKMTVPPGTMPRSVQPVRVWQLKGLIDKNVPKQEMPGLIASLRNVPTDQEKQTEFQWMFVLALENLLIDRGDRDNLVALFSTHFTSRMLGATTETVLVVEGKKMKDPILVLGEAFDRSKEPVIRKRIATAVHQSFDGNAVKGENDEPFVKNAMKWYQDNKSRLVLNKYHDDGGYPGRKWVDFPLYYIPGDAEDDKK
jgi:hypothetical protein